MTYVDPSTGEIHAAFAEGLLLVDLGEPDEESSSGPLWLGDWYTQQLCRIEAERAALKAQHARLMAELAAREKALAWKWRGALEEVVRTMLAKSKRKSVDFAYGRCGWRRSKRVEVVDEEAAMAWARSRWPGAIKRTESLLKSELPDREVPGVQRRDEDVFYVRSGGAS